MNESTSQKDSACQQVWIFQHRINDEKYILQNVQGKSRDSSIYQMIWRYFVANKLSSIISINGSITGDKYIALLQENLLSYFDALACDGITNITFQ